MEVRRSNPVCGRDWKVKSGLRLQAGAQPDATAAGEYGGSTMRFMPRVLVFVLGIALLLGFGILVYGDNSPAQPPTEFAPPTDLRASNRSELIVLFQESRRDEGPSWDAPMGFPGTSRETYTTMERKFTAQLDLLGGVVYTTRTAAGNFIDLPFESMAEPADTRNVTFR